ncbi:MAG: hypothetical protein ACREVF_09955, partial [Burkholderiales bacterium]
MCQVRRMAFPLLRAACGIPSVAPLMELFAPQSAKPVPTPLTDCAARESSALASVFSAAKVAATPGRFQIHQKNSRSAPALLELEGKAHARLPVLLDLGAIEILVHWGARFNQDQRVFNTDEFTADRRAAEDLD